MTDGDALYRAILACPAEDTPRLVYADWLDDNGQPERAEFIRLQVELARLPSLDLVPWNTRAIELRARERALLARREAEWLAPFRAKGEPLHGGDATGQFHRGFVEIVWMPAAWFCQRAESLLDRLPVRELRITRTTEAEFGKLMEHPLLGRLAGLDLSDRVLGNIAARLVAWSPFTHALRVLRLRGCALRDDGALHLADADFGQPFEELDVSYNPITRPVVQILRDRYGPVLRADFMERFPA